MYADKLSNFQKFKGYLLTIHFSMITRNLQIVPKNPNIDDTHLVGRWSLGSYKIKMKKNLSLIKFKSEKKFCWKIAKVWNGISCYFVAIMCDIWSHTSRYFYLRKKQDFFFKLNFLSEEFICWIWKDIFLCQSFTGLYLTEIIWIISVLSQSKKKCWGRFRVGFSCQTFFLFSESLALTSQKNSVT